MLPSLKSNKFVEVAGLEVELSVGFTKVSQLFPEKYK